MGIFCTKQQTEPEYELENLATDACRNSSSSRDCKYNNMQNLNTNKSFVMSNNDQIEDNRHLAVKTEKAISNQVNKQRRTSARSSTERKSIPRTNVHDYGTSLESSDDEEVWDLNKKIAGSHSPSKPDSDLYVGENANKGIHNSEKKNHIDDSLYRKNKNNAGTDTTLAGSHSPWKPDSDLYVGENAYKGIHNSDEKKNHNDDSLYRKNKNIAGTDTTLAGSHSPSKPDSDLYVGENANKGIQNSDEKKNHNDDSLYRKNKNNAGTDTTLAGSHSPSKPDSDFYVGENANTGIHNSDEKKHHNDDSLYRKNKNNAGTDTTLAGSHSPSEPISNINVDENKNRGLHTLHKGNRSDDDALYRVNISKTGTAMTRNTLEDKNHRNKADTQTATKPASYSVIDKHDKEDVEIIYERTKTGDGTSFAMTKDMAETVDQRLRNHTGVRIVLIGKTGSGKSCTGNTILRRQAFISSDSANSVTSECKSEKSKINGRIVTVVDTPGIFDTRHTDDEIQTEIFRCICMVVPGPHAIILVVPFGRFTEETQESFDYFCKQFGDDMFNYLIILFTKSEDLKHTEQTLDDYVHNSSRLACFAKKCGDRYVGFSNTASERNKGKQVLNLLSQIDAMVHKNGGACYTNAMFKRVQERITMDIKKEKEERDKEYERQVRLIERDVSVKYQIKIKQHEKRISLLEREDLTTIHNIEKMKKELEDRIEHEISELESQKNIEIEELTTQRIQASEKGLQFKSIKKRCMSYVETAKAFFKKKGSSLKHWIEEYNESHV